MSKPRLIAFYLPQYHPFKENDEWWGKGFTEWTNVGKAKPLFPGHSQPKIPRDLGYYDLRVPETREEQARLAKFAGIEGFCYWHYWFGNGKRLMERPFSEVLSSGKPDYPFCLGWANHSWYAKNWNTSETGRHDRMLIEQKYGGVEDYTLHFETMLPAFLDKRYMKVDGRPIFLIWEPEGIPSFPEFKETWNMLASKNGLKDFYFIGFAYGDKRIKKIQDIGLDAICADYMYEAFEYGIGYFKRVARKVLNTFGLKIPRVITYKYYADYFLSHFRSEKCNMIPCVASNFDHSPRSKENASILVKQSPEAFIGLLSKTIDIQNKNGRDTNNLIFIKSWNEWGEGNYLEPDLEFGDAYIQMLHNLMEKKE